MSFLSALDFIVDGENLDETVVNRPYKQIIGRYDLFERIENESTLNMIFSEETFKVYQEEGMTRLPFEDLVNFSRASTATYIPAPDGFLRTADIDEPRFVYNPETDEFDGLLIEEARTNEIVWTELFTNDYTYWNGNPDIIITPYAEYAPDGTLTANKFQWSSQGASSEVRIFQEGPEGDLSGKTFVFSCWLKFPTTNTVSDVKFQIVSSQFHVSSVITVPADGEWHRIQETVTVDPSDTETFHNFRFDIQSSAATADDYVYGWGFQVEEATNATSYIPMMPTFKSRSSVGSYFDKNGNLVFLGPDLERTDAHVPYNGKWVPIGKTLIEPERTNNLDESAGEFWLNQGTTKLELNQSIFNQLPGYEIGSGDALTDHAVMNSNTLFSDTLYAVTVYYKEGTSGNVRVSFRNYINSDLTVIAGPVASPSVIDVGDGEVFDLNVEYIAANDVWKMTFLFEPFGSTTHAIGIGPYSTTVGESVILVAAQVEEGNYPTSYIRTLGVPVTRTADKVYPVQVDITRASTATYFDQNGIIQTAAIDEPRDNAHKYVEGFGWELLPVLVEPERTNLAPESTGLFTNDRFTGWDEGPGVQTVRLNLNVFGSLPGTEIRSSFLTTLYTDVGVLTNLTDYTVTVYARGAFTTGADEIRIELHNEDTGSNTRLSGPMDNVAVTRTEAGPISNIESTYIAPDDVWKYTFTISFQQDGTPSLGCFFRIGTNSDNTDNKLILLAAQFEEGSTPTSYIPTSGSTVTRAADVENFTDLPLEVNSRSADLFERDFDIEINENEGTFYSEGIVGDDNSERGIFSVYYEYKDKYKLYSVTIGDDNTLSLFTGFEEIILSFPAVVEGDEYRFALAVDENGWTAALNGEIDSGTEDGIIQSLSFIEDVKSIETPASNNSTSSQFFYMPQAFTIPELKEITLL